MIASCGFMEDELRQCSKEERCDNGRQRENAWSRRLENKSKEVGSQRKSEKEEVQGEILAYQEECLPEEPHEGGGQEVVASGYGPARAWGVHAVGIALAERFKLRRQMAAAAGKNSTTSLSLFMEAFGLKVEEELSTVASQTWAEGVWIGTWPAEHK